MAEPVEVLDVAPLGVRVEILRTAEQTGGELVEFDVVGRPRGFIAQPHIHVDQVESYEQIEGTMRLDVGRRKHLLGPGQTMSVPAGAKHRQRAAGAAGGRTRVQLRPAGRTQEFLRRLAQIADDGDYLPGGWPRAVAAARLIRDFADTGRGTALPAGVQSAFADAVLRLGSNEYVFVDEWDVAAPPEPVFDALADGRTYREWWVPVYIGVDADGPPALGQVSRQHFKGRLPYTLRTTSRIVRYEPPLVVAADVDGDLRGRGVWTLAPNHDGGTHVRFDWRVHADRRLLRLLTPLLRPAFRWNHNWAIERAMAGLEPFARRSAAAARAAGKETGAPV